MRLSNNRLFSLTVALLGGVWCLCLCLIVGLLMPKLRYAGGLIGGIVAVAISLVYLLRFRRFPSKAAEEVGALGVYFTAVYVVVALAANTVFILLQLGGFNPVLLVCNLLIMVVYILVILYTERNTRRVSERLERAAQKTAVPTELSIALGRIVAKTEEGELRQRLLKLKESVDYSSNTTTADSAAAEKIMVEQLAALEEMITNQRDYAEILSKIREAEITWKTRGSQIRR